MMRLQDEIVQQHRRVDDLHSIIEKMIRERRSDFDDGDRVWYPFNDFVQFAQGDNSAKDIIFQVPENVDYVAERLTLYPSFRFVTTDEATNGPDEIVFRPCILSTYEGAFTISGAQAAFGSDAASIDCRVQLSETYIDENGQQRNRSYQNMPWPVELMFGGAVNHAPTNESDDPAGVIPAPIIDPYYNSFQFPMGLVFDLPWYLTAGSSLQMKISPNFSNVRNGTDLTRQNEYRLTAVLEGYKVVR